MTDYYVRTLSVLTGLRLMEALRAGEAVGDADTVYLPLSFFFSSPPSVILRPQSRGAEKNTEIKTGGSSHSICQSHLSGPRAYRGIKLKRDK